MALVPQVVKNTSKFKIELLDLVNFEGRVVVIQVAEQVDLFSQVLDAEVVKSVYVKHFVSTGALQVLASFDTSNAQASAVVQAKDQINSTRVLLNTSVRALSATEANSNVLAGDISGLALEKATKGSVVSTANATDLATTITLVNELKAQINRMNA